MKKLIAMMAITAIATMTQAASISWQSGTLYLPTSATDGTWSSTQVAAGQVTAYYFILTASEYANSATLLDTVSAQILAGTFNYAGADKAIPAAGLVNKVANWTNQGNFVANEWGYMLSVYLLNDTANDMQWFIATTNAKQINGAGDNATVQNIANGIGVWRPIPEPATMALLGIGIVAVGLRRRRK